MPITNNSVVSPTVSTNLTYIRFVNGSPVNIPPGRRLRMWEDDDNNDDDDTSIHEDDME